MTPTLRFAAGSDVGRRRESNQDSAYVSARMLAVADGMGGHAHGEVASAIAVRAMVALDERLGSGEPPEGEPLALLEAAVREAARRLTELADEDGALRGSGTTLVVLVAQGTRLAIAHIGDSRAYLLRGGELLRLTRDHTLVQTLVDEGRLTPAEAAGHPRRSVLVRTLQESTEPDPELFQVEGAVGDRYLLCSDGVTTVLTDEEVGSVLQEVAEPTAVVARLIELANAAGGPDNITAVVGDLVESGEPGDGPVLVGSAAC